MNELTHRNKKLKTKIVEAISNDGLYLKAAISTFDETDWEQPAITTSQYRDRKTSLLKNEGWTKRHFIIQDLSPPGGGAIDRTYCRHKHKAAFA